MNNNNNSNRGNNNNRRRGRGNRQQQGGGNQNRIDSRARGNAPQMLDKYKKLAQDAQHHGDRVQAEYYLQFADHYFRVIADNRVRQEEPRGGRREERDFSNEEDGDEDDFGSARNSRDDRPREERQRDDRPREDRQRDERPRDDRQRDDRPREDRPREDRQREDGQRDDRARGGKDRGRGAERQRRPREDNDGNREQAEGERAVEGDSAAAYEPAENPFVRPARERTARRPRTRATEGTDETEEMVGDRGEIDAAALPPSISAGSPVADTDGEAAPATRKLPPRRRRKVADEAGEGDNLTAVG